MARKFERKEKIIRPKLKIFVWAKGSTEEVSNRTVKRRVDGGKGY